MIKSFEPIVDKNSKLIILGSMPGAESLRKQEYYAFVRNQFWHIIYSIFDEVPSEYYTEKIVFMRRHMLALWDVLKQCEREGSLDSNIKNETPNNLLYIFDKYPNINYVLFNGTKAESSFKKYIGFNIPFNLEYFLLPSTSPANTKPLYKKIEDWKLIRQLINKS